MTADQDDFYPRPPRGGRPIWCVTGCAFWLFLSTPSARRATSMARVASSMRFDFYPRPPRGGRPARSQSAAGGGHFYPRPPRGGRRRSPRRGVVDQQISIHALREEGDPRRGRQKGQKDISIHALREEGDSKNGEKHLHFCFIIKRSAQIWKSLSKNIRKKSRDLHRTA